MENLPDWFHGVDGGGNCLPGPQIPRGIVRVGPDMINHNTSGYSSGEDLRHFSHLHVAGTGGQGRYGNIGIVPMGQRPDDRSIAFHMENETAKSGYYSVEIKQNNGFGELANTGKIHCEITATRSCAVHRWTFDRTLDPWVRVDVGAVIGGKSTGGWSRWMGNKTLVGCGIYRGGWGHNLPYMVFFHINFSEEVDSHTVNSLFQFNQANLDGDGPNLVVTAHFKNAHKVEARVGISFVSVAQAQRHIQEEIGDRDFEAVSQETATVWNDLLSRFSVEGGTADDRTLWATMWQRLHAMPGDLGTDEVPWMAAEKKQFNDLYCLWDSVRCANSLFALVDPQFAGDLCNSLVEIGEQTGWIPDAWIMGGSAFIQGGCSSAVLFAEAALKELPGFEPKRALKSLMATTETPTPDPTRMGRYPGWATDGFLSTNVRNCASRTVEYAFHDHCTIALAEAAGDEEAAELFRNRAKHLWDSWHPEHKCFAPRKPDGSWEDFNPWKPTCRDFWNDPHFYEGTGHDYAITAWHAMDELVERHGGAEAFAVHIEKYLEDCYFWKEINLHAPWLFHFAGMSERIAPALRKLMDLKVIPGRKGLADNEDMGAWSSWWITAAMGLCPVPGSDRYLVAAPRFERIQIAIPGANAPLIIKTTGPSTGSLEGISLNGVSLDRFYLTHGEISQGAEVTIHLS